MEYYHRYTQGGGREVVCIRCFLTLGTAHDIIAARKMEAEHICGGQAGSFPAMLVAPRRSAAIKYGKTTWRTPTGLAMKRLGKLNLLLAFVFTPIILYALPTAVELVASRHMSPWISSILPGDVAGCVFLLAVLGMRRTGVLLYLFLTAAEGCLYQAHLVSAQALPWIVDSVPTLTAMAFLWRLRVREQPPQIACS